MGIGQGLGRLVLPGPDRDQAERARPSRSPAGLGPAGGVPASAPSARGAHPRYLLRLIELELIERERRTVERRIRAARFPAVKTLVTFDFTAIPGLNKMLVLELARCDYILRRENFSALGNSGNG